MLCSKPKVSISLNVNILTMAFKTLWDPSLLPHLSLFYCSPCYLPLSSYIGLPVVRAFALAVLAAWNVLITLTY